MTEILAEQGLVPGHIEGDGCTEEEKQWIHMIRQGQHGKLSSDWIAYIPDMASD